MLLAFALALAGSGALADEVEDAHKLARPEPAIPKTVKPEANLTSANSIELAQKDILTAFIRRKAAPN